MSSVRPIAVLPRRLLVRQGQTSWREIVAELKPGLSVVVVGKQDFGIASVQYEVETARGPRKNGWVHTFHLRAESLICGLALGASERWKPCCFRESRPQGVPLGVELTGRALPASRGRRLPVP